MSGLEPTYKVQIYDPAQRAYVLPCSGDGSGKLEFTLAEAAEGEKDVFVENPAFVFKDWGTSGVELKVDGKTVKQGKDFRVGYEETHTGSDLIVWIKMKTNKTVRFSISPVDK
jgi:hypothetical protein